MAFGPAFLGSFSPPIHGVHFKAKWATKAVMAINLATLAVSHVGSQAAKPTKPLTAAIVLAKPLRAELFGSTPSSSSFWPALTTMPMKS